MKTNHIILALVLGLIVFRLNAQSLSCTFRGHSNDDLYYVNCTFLHLSYISEDGALIKLNNTQVSWTDQYYAETTSGYVYMLANDGIMESKDNGKTFSQLLYPWLTPETSLQNIKGGEIQGHAYIFSHNYSTSDDNKLKTIDSFETVGITAYFPEEIGVSAQEYYLLNTNIENLCILHTINDGVTFDTICIPDNIINANFTFYKLSRGSISGELFLITRNINTFYPLFKLYHSIDFGLNWNEKELPVALTEDAKFTAGRGNCKYYIVDNEWNGGETYTVKIYASSNCGETYTLYTHELPTYVGLGDDNEKQSQLIFSPNPAGNYTSVSWQQKSNQRQMLQIFGSTGQLVLSKDMGIPTAGNNSFSIDVHTLTNGIYQVKLIAENGEIRYGKLVVCR